MVYIKSALVSGCFKVAVCPQLPIKGFSLLIGNELAGGKLLSVPEVISKPLTHADVDSSVFVPVC